MKKLLLSALILLIPLFLYSSVLSPEGAQIITTGHFSIIYGPDSEDTAAHIYENCESIYSELVSMLGTDPGLKIPVVISNLYEVSNAYYTSYPYNMIVLYDTGAASPALNVFEDSILSIFRHELTHALTLNIRNPLAEKVSSVFGDMVSPVKMLYSDKFFTEGIAVFSESRSGAGRLNDASVTEIIRQSRLDSSFPSWTEANGSRDIYGRGTISYIFGGAFMSYLASVYSEDTLFEYFRQAGTFRLFTLARGLFISVFGISPEEAWKAFEESIAVPEKVSEPEVLSIISFKSNQSFESTSYFDSYFYTVSSASGNLYRFSSDGKTCEKLADVYSAYPCADISTDGLILSNRTLNQKSEMIVTDRDGKALLHFARGGRAGCFITQKNALKALIYSTEGQMGKLGLYNMAGEEEKTFDLGYDITVLSMDGRENEALLLLREGLERKIVLFDIESGEMTSFDAGEDILINSVSYAGDAADIIFSYNLSDPSAPALSRLGNAAIDRNTKSARIYLSDIDFSGGVHSPSTDGESVFYIGRRLDGDFTALAPLSSFNLRYDRTVYSEAETKTGFEKTEIDAAQYKVLENLGRGALFPFARYTSETVSPGLYYITTDLTQSLEISASAGYLIKEKKMFINAGLKYTALPVDLSLKAVIIPSESYILQAGVEKTFVLSRDSEKIVLSDTLSLTYDKDFSLTNTFSAKYSFVKRTGLNYYDKTGYSLSFTHTKEKTQASAAYAFSPVLPLRCSGRFTYNLPLTLSASAVFFPKSKETYLIGGLYATLFAYDIQDNFPGTGIYIKRIHLDSSYKHQILFTQNHKPEHLNIAQAFLYCEFSPAIGGNLSEVNFTAGPHMKWYVGIKGPEFGFTIKVSE